MKYWYDTEFIDDGRTIDLVSIGIVAQDGREYYAVSSEFDQILLRARTWLCNNVWPSLPKVVHPNVSLGVLDLNHPDVRPRVRIAAEVAEFLRVGLTEGGAQAELWSWYPAYDHVVLAQLFGPMDDLPKHIPWRTNDVEQEAERLEITGLLPDKPEGQHNALVDARYHRQLWEFVTTWPDTVG